ncbi:MAG: phosphoribosylamine--glycine ligase [Ferruginibacter sp.]|nr:phosphoribosylamine--glycine ligase [Ferruginibacter sp.]
MNILIIGSGGREHTLAWKLKQSNQCSNLFIAPGNAGTALEGTNLEISINDFEGLKNAALENKVELIIVGPEEPLVKGIVDYFKNDAKTMHINVIGPSKNASQLEGSKAFAKSFMQRHGIPTAPYREFTADNYEDGVAYIKSQSLPVVIKADGLAAGKGVLICQSHIEALAEFELIIHRAKFGDAGNKVVVESFLQGIEVSVFAITDGENYLMLPEAKDYKRVGEGDKGLNTGGMGAVSPLPFFDEILKQKIIHRIVEPTIKGLGKDELEYRGFIFFGLMINNGEPLVIEYNCRLGDPETEVIIPRMKNDLVELFTAVTNGKLSEISISLDSRCAAAVVAVSGGYPGNYTKGKPIEGLLEKTVEDSLVFHAGTLQKDKQIVTNGGRVMVVTAFGSNIREAAEQSVYMMEQLYFEDMKFRSDIGYEFA